MWVYVDICTKFYTCVLYVLYRGVLKLYETTIIPVCIAPRKATERELYGILWKLYCIHKRYTKTLDQIDIYKNWSI